MRNTFTRLSCQVSLLSLSLFGLAVGGCGEASAPGELIEKQVQSLSQSAVVDDDADTAADAPSLRAECAHGPRAKSAPHRVVVSHPYDASGDAATGFEVFALADDGTLTSTHATFQMGTMTDGEVVFTPDGSVGLAVQNDGSIGVFNFDNKGVVHVVNAAYTATYANRLVMDPSGKRVYILNNEWRDFGGGIHVAGIGCDGTLTDEGLLAAAKLPAGLVLLPAEPGQRPASAVVAARDILDSAAGDSVHLLKWPKTPTTLKILGGTDGFGDDQENVTAVVKTPDNKYVLVSDNNEFSGIPNRIAVLAVNRGTLQRTQMLTPIEDPVALVVSPYNNAAMVVSGYGNAFLRLSYTPTDKVTPFVNQGPITYVGIKPQLPAAAVLLPSGPLKGHVLVVETEGVRQVVFQADGTIKDLGLTALGDGLDTIVGGIGVTP